ncbi:MAG: reverse transcriptase domain-containing protein [Candidatus Thiodiazotropha sp.]
MLIAWVLSAALSPNSRYGKKLGIQVNPSPGLCLDAWEVELENDPDKEFLLNGIRHGFDIIDRDIQIKPTKSKNHPSARPGSPLYEKATKQILQEIENGHYVICHTPPAIVSPMAAIPKPDGDVRLIHDCSRPSGKSVNDYCSSEWGQKFSRVDDAAALMTDGCYFAKVDLKSAYRSVKISESSQKATGLKWNFDGTEVFLRDSRLCFGAKLSPGIFHRLTQAVKRMMARRGFDLLIVYLDDFLIIADSKEKCATALNCLIQLLRKLGFSIHWGKVVDPTTRIIFLGIELDSLSMSLSLPADKLNTFKAELKEFLQRKRASKRQLQAIAGRLSWAAGVVKGGRVFLRRIFDQIGMLKHASHKAVISPEMRQDLLWWYTFLETFNGKSAILDQQPLFSVFTDACDDAAGGSFYQDWFYFNWAQDLPEAATLHINEKEVLAVVLAAQRWAKFWVNKRIILHSDNMVTVSCVNRGTSRNKLVMRCLRRLFWLSASYNFHLTARYLKGCLNVAADSASRLHSPGYLQTLLPFTDYSPLWLHMSSQSLHFLLNRFQCWWPQNIVPRPVGIGCSRPCWNKNFF